YAQSDKDEALFLAWANGLEKIIGKLNAGKYLNYLAFSKNFFSDNALYYSDAIVWTSTSSSFEFGFDSLAFLKVGKGDLVCKTRSDNSFIINTEGTLYPTEYKFVGKEGKVLWTRTGLEEKEANAMLKNYLINIKTS